MKKNRSKVLAVILSLSMLTGLMPAMTLTASATDSPTPVTPGSDDYNSETVGTAPVPRTIGDWNYSILDGNGAVHSNSATDAAPYIDVGTELGASNSVMIPDASNRALMVAGIYEQDKYFKVVPANGNEFKLKSLRLESNTHDSDSVRIIGYLDGNPVSGASLTVATPVMMITPVIFLGAEWADIDEFRMVAVSNGIEVSDIAFFMDDLTVADPVKSITGIILSPYSGSYDGTGHNAVAVSGTVAGDTVTYSTDGTNYTSSCPQYTDVGSYSVYVKVERAGYATWESGKITASIHMAAGSIMITGNPSKTYDGSAVNDPTVSKNSSGTVTYTYYNDSSNSMGTALAGAPSAAGTYWVKASMAQDTNYSAAEASKKFSISCRDMVGTIVSLTGSALTGAVLSANAAPLPADATYSYEWRLNGAAISGETGSSYTVKASDYGKTITVALVANGNYSGTIESSGVTISENIAPTGSISIGINQWSSFMNLLTFGHYFKDAQIVTITATDNGGSGVKSIQYYKSATELSLADLQSLSSWNNYSIAFPVTATDTNKFVIYAKITDNAGNVTYINSNGMTFDTQGPSITTEYTKGASSMQVTVTDSGCGVQSVTYKIGSGSTQTATLDVDGRFTVASLPDGKYDVVINAADALTNTSSKTVNVASLYTVKFMLYSGDTGAALKSETVEYGGSATAPSNPTRAGFTFKGWDSSYNNITADTTVNATWDISGITVSPYSGTYNGTAHDAVTIAGTLAGDTISYSTDGTNYSTVCPKYTNAGSYQVYVRVARSGYIAWESGMKTVDIGRATGSITITGNPSKTYDGTPASNPTVTKNGSGAVTFTYYDTAIDGSIGLPMVSAPVTAGTYWVKASMAEDTNYFAAEDTKAFAITFPSITGSVNIPKTIMTDSTVTAGTAGVLPAGATFDYEWQLNGTAIPGETGSSYTVKASDYGKTLTVMLVANGNYSGTIKSNSVIIGEDVAPTGGITIGSNQWTTFLNGLTFGHYFKDTQSVTITAADNGGSGVKSIQYYKSATELSLADLQSLTSWNNYSSSLSITPKDAEKFVIYAKITDNAGNVIYINSNGMTFDTQGPSITTDYTKGASSMQVTVTDGGSGVQSVTYKIGSGSTQVATLGSNGKFTISSLTEGKYDVVINAMDTLGNISSKTVNVASLYTVTFKLYSGDTGAALKSETVEYGGSATAPSNPTRAGFAFKGWDDSFSDIIANTTVNGTWDVTADVTSYSGVYDGTTHDAVMVEGTLAGDTITYSTNGIDYTSACPQYTNAGSYPIYVRVARAGYTTWESGLTTATISQKAITSDMISDVASAVYTGTAIKPQLTVNNGSTVLKNGTDYTIDYSNNTDIGIAEVTVTGCGNYTGAVTKKFAIYAKDTGVEIKTSQTPQVLVDGLQNAFSDSSVYTQEDRKIEQNGGSVNLKLSVQAESSASSSVEKIESLASDKTFALFLDITLIKTVTPVGQQAGTSTTISHLNNLLTVVIPLPDSARGKQGIALYRVHEGVASVIPVGKENAVDGEYCTIDSENITLYVNNFSTYAIGFTPLESSNIQSTVNPKTGDYGYEMPFLWLLLSVSVGFILIINRKKKHS